MPNQSVRGACESDWFSSDLLSADTCKLCGGQRLVRLYTSRRTSLPVVRCRACGLIFIGRGFSARSQQQFYGRPEDYRLFAEAEQSLPEVASRHLEWLELIRSSLHGVVEGRAPRLLDVGCGAGDFLSRAPQAGFEAWGVEVSEPAARLAREWHHIDVRVGDVADETRSGFFDAVTAIGLLEHVTDPQALLYQMRRLLAPNGVMFVYTPVWGSYDRLSSTLARLTTGRMTRLIDRRINRAHLQIFPKHTIVDTLRQQGWEVIHSEAVCEYNLPVKHYLQSIGVTHVPVQRLVAAFLKTLIDRRALFRNNLRLLARKLSGEDPVAANRMAMPPPPADA